MKIVPMVPFSDSSLKISTNCCIPIRTGWNEVQKRWVNRLGAQQLIPGVGEKGGVEVRGEAFSEDFSDNSSPRHYSTKQLS